MRYLERLAGKAGRVTKPAKLVAERLTLGYEGGNVVEDLDLEVPAGLITSIIGPNGCGKSTLLRALARLMRPRGGSVLLDGREIHTLPTRDVARQLGVLPQAPQVPEGLTVRELAAQGRYPHQSWLSQWSASDERAVEEALRRTGMLHLADRPLDTLSGGQRQRAWISMALAQETGTLLLDEPTTFLDMAHQIEVLQLLQELNAREGHTIVMVLHDLNSAVWYAHHMVVLWREGLYAAGPPKEVMTPGLLRDVFGVEGVMLTEPRSGLPLCVPYGLAKGAGG
ncbi:ABC transporter ATP-binding protein [Rubrobacter calidifluminis]|uniref:ABC transporter ATP-binding protein n=1 Tax=Rubrobacter calidifluminis TaxID=1392640 RepID=UPI00235EF709|nr:ABC transporter ATP-binding protein [Rubrobacter calidifluminis]